LFTGAAGAPAHLCLQDALALFLQAVALEVGPFPQTLIASALQSQLFTGATGAPAHLCLQDDLALFLQAVALEVGPLPHFWIATALQSQLFTGAGFTGALGTAHPCWQIALA
jgi:hypothetical protein